MSQEIHRLKTEVAVLLACARTRLDKAKWAFIQGLLQEMEERVGPSSEDLSRQLLQERDHLSAIIEKCRGTDAVIMTRRK
ncbi:MAG: hypothetical protein HY644_07660 [Acidobacteria bacterium]|nr:hypothetical protein [Acidobacteriota bacterium]